MPQAWISRTAMPAISGGKPIDRRFAPDRREGEAVDLLGIAQIGEHRRPLLQIVRIALARPVAMARMGMGRVMMAVLPGTMAVAVIMVVPMVVCRAHAHDACP